MELKIVELMENANPMTVMLAGVVGGMVVLLLVHLFLRMISERESLRSDNVDLNRKIKGAGDGFRENLQKTQRVVDMIRADQRSVDDSTLEEIVEHEEYLDGLRSAGRVLMERMEGNSSKASSLSDNLAQLGTRAKIVNRENQNAVDGIIRDGQEVSRDISTLRKVVSGHSGIEGGLSELKSMIGDFNRLIEPLERRMKG